MGRAKKLRAIADEIVSAGEARGWEPVEIGDQGFDAFLAAAREAADQMAWAYLIRIHQHSRGKAELRGYNKGFYAWSQIAELLGSDEAWEGARRDVRVRRLLFETVGDEDRIVTLKFFKAVEAAVWIPQVAGHRHRHESFGLWFGDWLVFQLCWYGRYHASFRRVTKLTCKINEIIRLQMVV